MRMSSVRVMAGYLSKPGGQVRSERVKVGPWPQLTDYCLSRALYAAACWACPGGCWLLCAGNGDIRYQMNVGWYISQFELCMTYPRIILKDGHYINDKTKIRNQCEIV